MRSRPPPSPPGKSSRWETDPADADAYFGKVLRATAKGTRLARAQAIKTFFLFLELRHKVEIHQMTGRVVECPIGETNRPRGDQQAKIRIPPAKSAGFFRGAGGVSACRKFGPAARNYTACRLMADVGPRVNEALALPDRGQRGPRQVRQASRPSWQGHPRLRTIFRVALAKAAAAHLPDWPDDIEYGLTVLLAGRVDGEPVLHSEMFPSCANG